jgi:hypothetical protein
MGDGVLLSQGGGGTVFSGEWGYVDLLSTGGTLLSRNGRCLLVLEGEGTSFFSWGGGCRLLLRGEGALAFHAMPFLGGGLLLSASY